MAYHDTASSFAGKRRRVRKQDSLSEPPRKSPHDDGAVDAASQRPLASRRCHVAGVGSKDISVVGRNRQKTSEKSPDVSATDDVSGELCSENVTVDRTVVPGGQMAGRKHSDVYSRINCQSAKSEYIGARKCVSTTISSPRHYTTDDVTTGYQGHVKVDCLDPYDLTPIMRSLSMECFDGTQESGWRPGSQVVRSDSMPESFPPDDDFGFTSVRNLRRGAICYDDSESVGLMAGLSLYV